MTHKKIVLFIAATGVCLIAVYFILVHFLNPSLRLEQLIPTLPGPTPAPLTASLNEIVGIVTARLPGQPGFSPVTPGLVLKLSSAVKTAQQSRVRLDLSNQSIVRLGENTLFVFQDEQKTIDGNHYLIDLGIGELWIILRDGQIEVQTPSGLAAVRGSFLYVSYYPENNATQITCLEGHCNLKNASGKVDLVAGESAIVYNADIPPSLGRMNNHDVTRWLVNNPEATLVIPPLLETSAALPSTTAGPSTTPPPTLAPTFLGTLPVTPSSAPSVSPAATLLSTLPPTSQPTSTQAAFYWTPIPPTSLPGAPAPTSTPTEIPVAACVGVTEIPISECNALAALYNSTNGSSWASKTGWLATITPCSWYGITCSGGHVLQLILYSNLLNGSIPPQIGNLSQLQKLSLDGNSLSGNVPPQIGNLSQLQWLNLAGNSLSGNIPPDLGNLHQVQRLNLAGNSLSGSIPPELGNLSQIQLLELYNNSLSGAIPPQLSGMVNLGELDLENNHLNGSIPIQLGTLSQLQTLNLSNNFFSNSIPFRIGNLSQLRQLWLANNSLSGSIPVQIKNLTQLMNLDLNYNSLFPQDASVKTFINPFNPGWDTTQTVPPVITSATPGLGQVTFVWVPIPYTADGGYYEVCGGASPGDRSTCYGQTTDKTASGITLTGLTPGLPYYFTVRTYTPAHVGQQNNLVSDFSSEVSATPLTVCQSLGVTEIPLAECDALVTLYNSTNGSSWTNKTGWLATGTPCSWYGIVCSLGHVNTINLYTNQLSGSIPAQIGSFPQLQYLRLYNNASLTGGIPTQIGSLSQLKDISIDHTAINGSIPVEICNLAQLQIMDLFLTNLSGSIPSCIGNLSQLQNLYVNNTPMSGIIPTTVGNLLNLSALDVSHTTINGTVPNQIGNLTNINYLVLNNTNLTGPLPLSLVNLTSLIGIYYNNTNICTPQDAAFLTWQSTRTTANVSGINCPP